MVKQFTQTDTKHGNCWQTAVACLLDIDPASLPDQVEIETAKVSYWNALNSYLIEHHRLFYSELHAYQVTGLSIRPDWYDGHHMLIGPTVRTPENGRNHVVVARFGECVWDPHPSRAGLTEIERWGVLGRADEIQHIQRREWHRGRPDPDVSMFCLCPKCKFNSPWGL